LKRKGSTRFGAYLGSSSGLKMNYRREGNASKCANHQVMILRDDGEIVSTSEESDCDEMPLEDSGDLEYAIGDEVLVIRRLLSFQTKKDDVEQKRRTSSILDV